MVGHTSDVCQSVTLLTRVEAAQHEMLAMRRRYFVLDAFAKELHRVTRDKEFRIFGDSVWLMVLDHRDMVLVHLASWVRGACGTGGLFNQLKNHLSELRKRRKDRAEADSRRRQQLDKDHEAAFVRLFPGIQTPFPQPPAIDALKSSFWSNLRKVVDDRDRNRAHPYERASKGDAKMLGVEEINEAFGLIEDLLNDLRLVATSSTMASTEMNLMSGDALAVDLVDLVLLGGSGRRSQLSDYADREGLYARMHEWHATTPERMFNEAPLFE